MKNLNMVAALAAFGMIVGSAWACDKDAKLAAEKQAVAAGPAGCCKTAAAGRVEQIMQRLPHMTYKVGDFVTACPEAASTKAGTDGKIQYLVAGEAYDCKAEALTELGVLLEGEAKKMAQVVYAVGEETYCCPMTAGQMAKSKSVSMTYRVAGVDFDSQDKATAAFKLVSVVMEPGSVQSQTQPAGQQASPGCAKSCAKGAAAASAAGAEAVKPGCGSTTKVAAGETKTDGTKPCCGSGAKLAAAGVQPVAGTPSAAGPGTPACCKAAEERVASVSAKIRLMVETAVTAM